MQLITKHVGDDLTEEVAEVHGDHDEDNEVVQKTDETKQSLRKKI